ncbi:clathrin-coated vesicle protein [Pleurotus eryngii]|uniref:Clathrin-coated vesicle protein n=1 Tax=Pleurotus eryngii TaxID=5323 RepID=A0A9P6A3X4_PLEER|nr:clathrin-coated vesicle protein [Pleurotus eryngii]
MAFDTPMITMIDEADVLGENGDMNLFSWLASTEKKLTDASPDILKGTQNTLEQTFVKIISASAPYTPPGRAIRQLVARCLIKLYRRGETRTLFDTLQALMKIVGDFKAIDKDSVRVAAFSCIGDLMHEFGSQVMSFMAEISMVTLRTAKSSNPPLLRYHALVALRKSLNSAKRAVTDASGKDIIKQMRNGLTDKCMPVQRASAEVLIAMYSADSLPSSSDVDAIITLCVKNLESVDQVTRRTLAQLVGHLLASTQVERTVVMQEPAAKVVKKDGQALGDDPLSPAGGTSTEIKKPMFTPVEMLAHLGTHFTKTLSSSSGLAARRTRVGIFDFYFSLITKLGASFVESNYALVVQHFMNDIVANPLLHKNAHANNLNAGSTLRYETLLIRSAVGILVRDVIGVRMLSEQGQIGAIQELSNSYLKRWPAMMPGQVAPSSAILVVALREVAGLLQQLGNAPPPVQDAVSEPLVTLLTHPSHSVRVNASWALRCFCYSTPLRLPRTILGVTDMLQRDLTSILSPAAPSDINLRALGHAYGLAALISIVKERPLYVSYDISAKVLDIATQLLKRAGDHDLKVAGVEVEVAWTLIASLMSLGPNFVRPHLPQLLVLWRNALPKPTSKEGMAAGSGRSIAEWMFLLHVRESALGAILCFLQHNSGTLVTLDVARRIASVLGNALSFANSFVGQNVEDPSENAQMPTTANRGLSLRGREALLRRRVFQCFSALGFSGITESTQVTLLQSTVSLFASPDGYAGSSMQAAIASSSGSFTSVWQSGDGYAYGVTHLDIEGADTAATDIAESESRDRLNRDSVETSIDELLRRPILGACEHDPLSVCQSTLINTEHYIPEPASPSTAVVDAAITLFSQLLPLQDSSSSAKIIGSMMESTRSNKFEKNLGRKAAVSVNSAVALVLALRVAGSLGTSRSREGLGSGQVTGLLSTFLKEALVDGDPVLRKASSECIGRLANIAGTNFLTSQMKSLVDQVVNNRDPYGRAGCSLAFGAIYTFVGGMAAGPLLKTTVNVLMSLSNDPHPLVHFWSLRALAQVINAASLTYAPFVSGTLGMLLKIYCMDSHEREGGTLANANMSGDFPAYPVVCQIIDAVITVLGPDIQESPRTRALILNLVQEFSAEGDDSIRVESIQCIQHFLMFAPEFVDIPRLVTQFRGYLASPRRPLKLASINALYQLVQKDALVMSRVGGDQLVEDLFGMLDDDSGVEGVKNVITSWLQQTVVHNPSAWIDLCQRIMSRTTASQQVADAASRQNMRDDEGESLNVGASSAAPGGSLGYQTSRWRTQLFALQCLHLICTTVAKSGRREQLDAVIARTLGLPTAGLLVSRVPDLIKMAFTASTAYVTEIRLEGLVVLRDVIETFSKAPDPAYEDSLLLEQHQAPITAALTPAFSSDSTPEILASAVHACAVFVGCGVVKDVGRMGRILKLLTTALDQSKESGMVSLGDTGQLSPNASSMLRISTLSAWAQLEIASAQQPYLVQVVNPHRSTLATLWIAALRDYASVRIDTEFLHDSSSVAVDSSYSSLGKEVLLPYYTVSWPIIIQAVATAMQSGDPHIVAAMDGQTFSVTDTITNTAGPRTEPTAFFYVVFGLVYEALATSSTEAAATPASTRDQLVIACLHALKYLVTPEYCGKAVMEPTAFEELLNLCYRMAMTESANVQIALTDMLLSWASSQDGGSDSLDLLSLTAPRTHCLRICSHIIQHSTSNSKGSIIQGEPAERARMLMAAFTAFATIAASIKSSQREDVRSVGILLYSELLKDESSEVDLVGPTLPSLKILLDLPVHGKPEAKEKFGKTVNALASACLLNIDGMSGRSGAISTKKVKNNLLAVMLILSVLPPTVRIGKSVVERCCFILSHKTMDNDDQVALTAVHCTRTLVAAATSQTGHPLLRHCCGLLLPGLIEYIAKIAPLISSGSVSDAHIVGIGEVWKAFSAIYASVPEEHRDRVLGVFLPTILLTLSNDDEATTTIGSTASPSLSMHASSITQILSFAALSPIAFKQAAAKLDPGARESLEQAVRKAVGKTTTQSPGQGTGQGGKPQISLRAF